MRISVIIPALNEASCLPDTLDRLQVLDPFEIIVVDGGSVDDTYTLARSHARVIQAERGRARQMNAGAQQASGDVFLFLHADTHLPQNAFSLIDRSLQDRGTDAGTFRLRFDSQTPLLQFYSFCTRFQIPTLCFGDRGLFIRKEVFIRINGFPEIPIFEDLEIVRRIRQTGKMTYVPAYVTTAARRFTTHGPFRQQLRNLKLWTRYLLGTSPEKLAPHYQYPAPTVE